ncbi:acidic fibroblast growth factor intracellular-binding protein B [Lepeophtheirus salmonis]|uniref:Acidic fibroblast growth factor intracellular-binding protein n=1 Tax=Lepeophtheirus salmonis TaxID=72036 RepID=A0A0K2V9G0_LEPSM|nr:acidic fibroblast growth factor intracellular-binding protein B-like [Lepeophtheirus salmonis]
MNIITSNFLADIDVFVGNYTLINWDVFDLWIDGLNVSECVSHLREKGIFSDFPHGCQDFLVSDINDSYRLFCMLEHLLLTTGKLSEQLTFQLDSHSKKRWVEKYYSLDSSLARELLGKKLSSRFKKDLDEISDKTGIHLKSCRRQFDNIKRIFKTVEEMSGCYVQNIVLQFNLPRGLAEKYATLVFLSSFKFEVNKKRLNYLSFEAISVSSLVLIDKWMDGDDANDQCLDRDFLSSLRELRPILDRDKEHRNYVCQGLSSLSPEAYGEVESNFKLLSRNILNIATGLNNNKEVKDFFVHVVEKIVEPLKSMGLIKAEVNTFLCAYTEAVTENKLLIDHETKLIFRKYMSFLFPCVLAFYQ